MRITTPILAAALIAATPALAQNQAATPNNADVTMPNAADANAVAVNDVAAVVDTTVVASNDATAAAPVNEEKHGFPWGVLGLLGLLGLIPRTRKRG